MDATWLLWQNPFLWQGVVFLLFGLVVGLALHSIFGFPRRLLETF